MQFPITINQIRASEDPFFTNSSGDVSTGDFVAVRPAAEEFGGKTYLGVFVGEIPLNVAVKEVEEGVIEVARSFYNPLILIPELGEVVYGFNSWWTKIDNEGDLRAITDADIENVWYVQALKRIQQAAQAEDAPAA